MKQAEEEHRDTRFERGWIGRWLEKRGGISAQGFISLQTQTLVYKGQRLGSAAGRQAAAGRKVAASKQLSTT